MDSVSAQGAKIPALGFGTWPMRGQACVRAVAEALSVGYRHIDTAQGYGNEADVGEAIAKSGVPRSEIFLTTKVVPARASKALCLASVEESLRKLRTDYVDLLLPHWPNPAIPVAETIEALCAVKKLGLIRNIGLSNYTIDLMDRAIAASSEPIVANQIEYHPFIRQTKILAAIRARGMAIIAYSPTARGTVTGNATIDAIARRHRKTAAQVALRWLVQQGDVVAIPKSSHPDRISENFAIFDFVLSSAEMAEISALARPNGRLIHDSSSVPRWDD